MWTCHARQFRNRRVHIREMLQYRHAVGRIEAAVPERQPHRVGSGEKHTLIIGLVFAAIGWGGSAVTHSLPLFIAMLVPGAIGIGLVNPSLVSLVSGAAGKQEQGRVQGAAGALESLGRTIGPVWGNGALQLFGEGVAYGSAALVLLGTAALTTRYEKPRNTPAAPSD